MYLHRRQAREESKVKRCSDEYHVKSWMDGIFLADSALFFFFVFCFLYALYENLMEECLFVNYL